MDFIWEDIENVEPAEEENTNGGWLSENSELEEEHEDESVGGYENESEFNLTELDDEELEHCEAENSVIESEATCEDDVTSKENDIKQEYNESDKHGYSPSFTGFGKCACGCASFVGSGKWCKACGHSYDAHRR